MSHFARQISKWVFSSRLNPTISLYSKRAKRNLFAKISHLIIISCLFANEEKISIENSFPDGAPKTIISYEITSSGMLIIKEKYGYKK